MNPKNSLWIGVCLAALMAVTLYFGLSQHPSSFDDAYITYRYARNIAQGRGFVYNVGEPVLGTTAPLYALLLASLSLIWSDIPTLSHFIGVLAWVLCVPVAYSIARSDDHEIAGLAAASLIAVNTLFLNVLGMETTWYVLVTLLAFYFYVREKPAWAGVCAGLAFLTRWDGMLVTAVLGFADVLKQRRRLPKSLVISACLIIPWLGYSQLVFGSIFPNTLFAKAGQGWKTGLGGTEIGSFPRGLVSTASSAYRENPLHVLLFGLSMVGIFSAIRNRVKWWPVMLWTAAYFGGYTVLGVLRFSWYYPPLIPPLVLLIGQGIEELTESLPSDFQWPRRAVAVLLIVLCLIPSVDWLVASRRSGMDKHIATYVEVGKWLRDHTPSDSSVATIEIGVIGFYSDRTIVDTMGLVSPEMVGHLDSWLQTLQFALNHYWPDYAVVLKGTAWDSVVRQAWFKEAYVLDSKVENLADPDAPVHIYRRGSKFPLDEFALTSSVGVSFDEKVALRRFQVAEEAVSSGENLHARLTWKALNDVKEIYTLRFDLLNTTSGQMTTLRAGAHPMRGGNPTDLWTKGERVIDDHTLRIPDNLESGNYLLRLLVSREGESPAMIDSNGQAVDYVVVGPIQIQGSAANISLPAYEVNAAFADHITLAGYSLSEHKRGALEITLYWQATAEVSKDYTVFVHLLSPEGELVAQHDSPPALPTALWVPGTPVVDSHILSLPQDASLDSCEIRTGLYHWPDLERLPIIRADGLDVSNDALLLRHIDLGGSPAQDEQAEN